LHLPGAARHADVGLDARPELPPLSPGEPAYVPGVRIATRIRAVRRAQGAGARAGEARDGTIGRGASAGAKAAQGGELITGSELAVVAQEIARAVWAHPSGRPQDPHQEQHRPPVERLASSHGA